MTKFVAMLKKRRLPLEFARHHEWPWCYLDRSIVHSGPEWSITSAFLPEHQVIGYVGDEDFLDGRGTA